MGVISAVFLLPIYSTGGNLKPGKRDELEYLTMGNVPPGSPRLYSSVLAAYAMTFTVLYFVWKEYKHYVDRKHFFMKQQNVSQYSVLLEHIPRVRLMSYDLISYIVKLNYPALHHHCRNSDPKKCWNNNSTTYFQVRSATSL